MLRIVLAPLAIALMCILYVPDYQWLDFSPQLTVRWQIIYSRGSNGRLALIEACRCSFISSRTQKYHAL